MNTVTLRHSRHVAVMLVDDPDFSGARIDRGNRTSTIWVNSSLSDEDILDVTNQAMGVMLRPALSPVDAEQEAQPEPDAAAPAERPALRLVGPRAGCLTGCVYAAEATAENDEHLCSVSVGESFVQLRDERQQACVSVDRFDEASGTEPAFVALGHVVNGRTHEPLEMTPSAARALAAQLIAAADTAEQANSDQQITPRPKLGLVRAGGAL